MSKAFQRLVSYLETSHFSLGGTAVCGFAFILLRNVFEQMVFASSDAGYWWWDFYHYNLCFLYVGTAAVVVVHGAARVPVTTAFRVVWPFLGLLCAAPLIDGAVMTLTGREYTLTYLFPQQHGSWWILLVTFFGPLAERGVTLGIRVEILAALWLAACYVRIKTGSVVRAAVAAFLLYALFFTTLSLPYLIAFFMGLMGLSHHTHSDGLMVRCLALGLAGWLAIGVGRAVPGLMRRVLADLRVGRWLFYGLWLLWGVAAGGRRMIFLNEPFESGHVLVAVLLLGVVWTLAWISAVWLNHYTDRREDAINSPHRAVVAHHVSARTALWVSGVSAGAAVVFAAALDFMAVFWVMVFIGVYALYSLEPIRLKRWGPVSKAAIGLNTAASACVGWHCSTGQWGLPAKGWWLIVGAVWLASHWIDLKDTRGDAAAGLRTLPVWLGQQRAQTLSAGLYIVGTTGMMFLFREAWFRWLIAGWAVTGAMLILKRPYRETGILWWTVAGTAVMTGLTAVGLIHIRV